MENCQHAYLVMNEKPSVWYHLRILCIMSRYWIMILVLFVYFISSGYWLQCSCIPTYDLEEWTVSPSCSRAVGQSVWNISVSSCKWRRHLGTVLQRERIHYALRLKSAAYSALTGGEERRVGWCCRGAALRIHWPEISAPGLNLRNMLCLITLISGLLRRIKTHFHFFSSRQP